MNDKMKFDAIMKEPEIKHERIHPELNIADEPVTNVMDSHIFQKRVAKVFEMVADTLKKSYGPFGSSTIISNYPFYHITKDGFSIMKVLAFAKDKTSIDDAIKNLIEKPCARLNYAVGDSTTTVILAVNEIYKSFIEMQEYFDTLELSPRDILRAYDQVRDDIIKKLDDEIYRIDINNHEEMVDLLTKVAYISSNGDEEITSMFHDLYDELGAPMIEIVKSKTTTTTKKITNGYFFDAVLKDGLYVNNDNMTAEYKDVDVLIFDHKVTMNTFDYIIFPLNIDCRTKGRHLIVIAPSYDDVAMRTIKRSLLEEYKSEGTANLVLMAGSMAHGINRDLSEDLAILLNTTIIGMGLEDDIIEKIKTKKVDSFRNILDTNQRGIPNIVITAKDKDGKIGYTTDTGHLSKDSNAFELTDGFIRVGYAGKVSLGLKNGSIFTDLHYSDFAYNSNYMMINNSLEEAKKKSETITSYNFQALELQKRLFNFKMIMGTIEVGGQSGLSQDMLYDLVEDAVKATSSAYYNGITKGCSVSILRAIKSVYEDEPDDKGIRKAIIKMIFKGFSNVYKILLGSKYDNRIIDDDPNNTVYQSYRFGAPFHPSFAKVNSVGEAVIDTFDAAIETSINWNKPIDLTTNEFSDDIINSAKSDKEVLLATSDLISLLITGNQFIVTERER